MAKVLDRMYGIELQERLANLLDRFDRNFQDTRTARVTPAPDDLRLGSARMVDAAAFVFDIRGFSQRTTSDNRDISLSALQLLNVVIPLTMSVIYDYDGYVEKNTGDGVFGILGVEQPESEGCDAALKAALTVKWAIEVVINPELAKRGIDRVAARYGVDYGPMLLARIGVPSGSSAHSRNFLTAVGATANLATRLQQNAGTDEIWVGDRVKLASVWSTEPGRFTDVTPLGWPWVYLRHGAPYRAWRFESGWAARI